MANMLSTKRALIDKSNTTTVVMVSVTAFIVMFSLVATKSLVSQAMYQNRVITAKRKAVTQLKADLQAAPTLVTSYKAFNTTTENIIGGNPAGSDQRDGQNSKIILDALPSNYDFPALATNLEVLGSKSARITSINGTDQELTEGKNTSSSTPTPVPILFDLTVTADYNNTKNFITDVEHSIRPIAIQKLEINGKQQSLTVHINAQTYYQPAKSLNIKTRIVK